MSYRGSPHRYRKQRLPEGDRKKTTTDKKSAYMCVYALCAFNSQCVCIKCTALAKMIRILCICKDVSVVCVEFAIKINNESNISINHSIEASRFLSCSLHKLIFSSVHKR